MRRPNASPSRSTARLMAAYTCGPRTRILSEPAGSRPTVTTQVTLSQLPRASVWRSTTRTRRTLRVWRARAANRRYSAYVRAWALIVSSPTTVIRFMRKISARRGPTLGRAKGRSPTRLTRGRVSKRKAGLQDERPYCFIFRQSVTVLIFSASAARRRLPPNFSRARSIMTRSCSCKSSVSSPGRRRVF